VGEIVDKGFVIQNYDGEITGWQNF
jgi:thiamine-monophosphate kinase